MRRQNFPIAGESDGLYSAGGGSVRVERLEEREFAGGGGGEVVDVDKVAGGDVEKRRR